MRKNVETLKTNTNLQLIIFTQYIVFHKSVFPKQDKLLYFIDIMLNFYKDF